MGVSALCITYNTIYLQTRQAYAPQYNQYYVLLNDRDLR